MDDISFSNDTPLLPSAEAWGTLSTFIKKDDANGNFLWGKIIHANNANYERVKSEKMVLDSEDNLYITGSFSSEVDFDPSQGTFFQNVGSDNDRLFILKLDSECGFVWVKTIAGTGSKFINDLSFDEQGFLNIVGTYNAEIDFGNDSQLPTVDTQDMATFIAKFDLAGELVFTQGISSEGTVCNGHAITTNTNGKIYISGSFLGSVDFDPNETENIVESLGNNRNQFVLKRNSDGGFNWVKTYSGNENPYFSNRIGKDLEDNIYICGSYRGETNFGTIENPDFHTPIDGKDVYVQKMNSNGDVYWTSIFGGEYDDQANDLGIDENENIYLTGYYSSYSDFGGSYSNTSVIKLNESGIIVWENIMPPSHFAQGISVFVKDASKIVVAGYYESTLEINTNEEITNLAAHESVDCFFLKVEPQNVSINELGKTEFTLFPNPATEEIIIENKGSEILEIEIFSSMGKLVYSSSINSTVQTKNIDVFDFSNGFYSLIIHYKNRVLTKSFLKV